MSSKPESYWLDRLASLGDERTEVQNSLKEVEEMTSKQEEISNMLSREHFKFRNAANDIAAEVRAFAPRTVRSTVLTCCAGCSALQEKEVEKETTTVKEQKAEAEGNEEKTESLRLEEKKLLNKRFQLISKRGSREALAQTYHDDSAKAEEDLDDMQAQKKNLETKDASLVELIAAAEEGASIITLAL